MFLELDDCKLFYEISGSTGPWVTLINGHTRSSKDFNQFQKKLVEEGFRVLTFDNRGSGQTKSNLDFTFSQLLNDVIALLNYNNINITNLVGISMGGILAQGLTLQVPDRINKLCLVSTTNTLLENSQNIEWENSLEKIKSKLQNFFDSSFLLNSNLLIEGMSKQIQKEILHENFLQRSNAQRQAINDINFPPNKLCEINSKTLIIHGETDEIIPLCHAMQLNKYIKNSKLVTIEKAGHLLIAEKPKLLYEFTCQFFQEN